MFFGYREYEDGYIDGFVRRPFFDAVDAIPRRPLGARTETTDASPRDAPFNSEGWHDAVQPGPRVLLAHVHRYLTDAEHFLSPFDTTRHVARGDLLLLPEPP